MITKTPGKNTGNSIKLDALLDKNHGLYRLANILNWDYLSENFGQFYNEAMGRPSIPIRSVDTTVSNFTGWEENLAGEG